MKHLKLVIIAFFTVGLLSSCDYLNVSSYFQDTLQPDSVFHNQKNILAYMWATTNNFPDEGQLQGGTYTPGPLATDEAFTAFRTSGYPGMAFAMGEINAENIGGASMDTWTSMYKIIRKANMILSRMNEVTDFTTAGRTELIAYTHFMRAYAYYNILENFGPVVLVGDLLLKNNEVSSYYDNQRATYDESVDYICSEFEMAAKYMPSNVLMTQFGRPTKGSAYGMIARLRLQQASPLFNGPKALIYFGDWKRKSDGVYYVSQTYNPRKWAVAAAAAKRVMDMGLYQLHTIEKDILTPALPLTVPTAAFPNGAGNIDPFRSYSFMFNGETTPQTNPEYVWGRMSTSQRDDIRNSFNVVMLGGWNGMCITQKVVDAYRMADGKDITNSSVAYPYSEVGMTTGSVSFSSYTLNGGISNMYANREMRFYASVGFSRRLWSCASTSNNSNKNITITYDRNGNSGRFSANSDQDYNHPPTGYVIAKNIHPNDAFEINGAGTGALRINKAFGIIRYAEILLSYAEALNNLTSSYTVTLPNDMGDSTAYVVSRDVNEMKASFNQVRFRAGLPGVTDAQLADPALFLAEIQRERMVEFLFENRRYFDVRRWGIYEQTDGQPIMGMNIEATEPLFYQKTMVNSARARNRVVLKKMIFLPISKFELQKVPGMDQNPGW